VLSKINKKRETKKIPPSIPSLSPPPDLFNEIQIENKNGNENENESINTKNKVNNFFLITDPLKKISISSTNTFQENVLDKDKWTWRPGG
jgi:hypothetical protein